LFPTGRVQARLFDDLAALITGFVVEMLYEPEGVVAVKHDRQGFHYAKRSGAVNREAAESPKDDCRPRND
jgi:hypothetical protein